MINQTKKLMATLYLSMLGFVIYAQDGLDIDIDLDGKEWYDNPMYVVIGIVVVLLILALIFRGKKA